MTCSWCTTLGRLGRTVRDTLNLIHDLAERGVGIRNLADRIKVDERLLHIAARITKAQHNVSRRLAEHWPCAVALARAFTRLRQIPLRASPASATASQPPSRALRHLALFRPARCRNIR